MKGPIQIFYLESNFLFPFKSFSKIQHIETYFKAFLRHCSGWRQGSHVSSAENIRWVPDIQTRSVTWYSAHLLTASRRTLGGAMQVRKKSVVPTRQYKTKPMPVEQTTGKQVQGTANTQKRRLRKGPSSCEGKCDWQNCTEWLSAFCSQTGWFSCTWEGYLNKYKTCDNKHPFQVPQVQTRKGRSLRERLTFEIPPPTLLKLIHGL